MPDQIPYIRVFLSSPSDVTDERKIALEVIERLPNRPAFRDRIAFRIIAWDKPGAGTPMRATLTPQEAINQGLPKPSECDIVVVLFWSRMGTPFVDTDGKEYLSGTHWELLDGLKSQRAETVIYRRTEKKLFESDDKDGAEQSERVKTFFRSELFYKDERIVRGINSYLTPDDFRQAFETDFEALVVRLLDKLKTTPAPSDPQLPALPQIKTAIPQVWPPDKSPFPGLTRFTEADADIFFGRGREIDALVRKVAESRFVAVIGASGSGKSSLVGAGLIPRLHANAISGSHLGSQDWFTARFAPGQGANPFEALGAALIETIPTLAHPNPLTYAKDLEAFANDLQARPDRLLTTLNNALKNEKAWAEVLLFIDQFEELFTLAEKEAGKETVQAFTLMLAEAAKSQRIRVVVTLRADFYQRAVPYPELAELLRNGSFPLAAPKREALREMIVRPAECANLTFEAGLVERILDDTGDEPGNLALLAYLLEELYRNRDQTGQLTAAVYDRLGGVQGAIGQRAEVLFEKLQATIHDDTLAGVFRELVDVDERGEATRQRALVSKVVRDAATEQLVTLFTGEQARLLVYDRDVEGLPTVEVAHEALLRQWPRLKAWIENEQDNLRLRRQIRQDAREWETHQRASGYLLMGSRLEDALRLQDTFTADNLETAFIQASIAENQRRTQKERDDQAERLRLAEENAASQRLAAANARAEVAERERAEAQSSRAIRARRAAIIAGIIGLIAAVAFGFSVSYANQTLHKVAFIGLEIDRFSTLNAGGIVVPLQTQTPGIFEPTLTAIAVLKATTPEVQIDGDMLMVKVPIGCFFMGSTLSRESQPITQQCFDKPFWIGQTEVTNAQYKAFIDDGGYDKKDYWTEAGWTWRIDTSDTLDPDHTQPLLLTYSTYNTPTQPVVGVSWYEAVAFCNWLSTKMGYAVRLPTEKEWEYAARGPDSLVYPWGNDWVAGNAVTGETLPLPEAPASVGSKPSGASWVGAFDMAGNVLEWMKTSYDSYPYKADDGREDVNANGNTVLRGGSWGGSWVSLENKDNARSAARDGSLRNYRYRNIGFRVVRPYSP